MKIREQIRLRNCLEGQYSVIPKRAGPLRNRVISEHETSTNQERHNFRPKGFSQNSNFVILESRLFESMILAAAGRSLEFENLKFEIRKILDLKLVDK